MQGSAVVGQDPGRLHHQRRRFQQPLVGLYHCIGVLRFRRNLLQQSSISRTAYEPQFRQLFRQRITQLNPSFDGPLFRRPLARRSQHRKRATNRGQRFRIQPRHPRYFHVRPPFHEAMIALDFVHTLLKPVRQPMGENPPQRVHIKAHTDRCTRAPCQPTG